MHAHVILGGTFDHIHTGHRTLLGRAFAEGEKVTIGLTSDRYVERYKTKTTPIYSYEIRKEHLKSWLKNNNVLNRTTIVPIDDAYGPAIKEAGFDAIVVSDETEPVAKKINILRTKKGILPFAILVVPMVPAEDSEAISSTRIRNGEIDHEGRFILPESLRKALTKPIGMLIPDNAPIAPVSKHIPIISVGDTTTAMLLSQGSIPTLAIIDFQARRQEFDWEEKQWRMLTKGRTTSYFASGPGFINKQVMDAIARWSENPKQTLIIIDGEEDLLVLPAILYAPLDTIVYYGQPEQGIVQVEVTKEKKQDVQQLLSHFIPHT